jgi:hypothetical protein
MTTTAQIRKAYNQDASTTPYFFRHNYDPALNLIIDTGKQAMLSCEPVFSKKISNDLIQSIYDNVWNRLDLILDINHRYFNLYYDYLLEMLDFYLKICEDNEQYDACINLRELIQLFNSYDKSSSTLFQ